MRIAVLGGGVAGTAAAYALSRTEEQRRRFEVTVYQADARLGGKGATTRDPRRGWRIEEHGLHLWMGFYGSAFRMMADCYGEGVAPWRSPEEAFARRHTVSFADGVRPLHLGLPPRPGVPWDDLPQRGDRRRLARWALRDLPGLARTLGGRPSQVRDLVALARVVSRGLVREVLPHGFDALDEIDLMAWLRKHGADRPEVYDAPPIRGMYNLAFAFPDGVAGPGRGALAAGPALRALLRMLFDYRGAPLWEMRAGMGDTVFAPLYRLLSRRGVRFAFGHEVRELRTDGRTVDAVELAVRSTGPALARLGPLDVWGPAEAAGEPRTRILRRGEDYDALVLAIPVPAHARVAAQLIARSERYRAMVEHSASVATAVCQLWLRPDLRRLRYDGPPTVQTNASGRFASYADLSGTAEYEGWAARPGHVAYFCDVVPDGTATAAGLAERAQAWADRDLVRLWPGAARDGRFDSSLLVHEPGEDPWRAQYFRVNDAASDRYVLTPPGSVRWRLPPEDSTFEGLFLAGDWTRTSIDGGSVEAAVESGHRAAAAALLWVDRPPRTLGTAAPNVVGGAPPGTLLSPRPAPR